VTLDITPDALFVPTDERGRQLHDNEATLWSPPGRKADGTLVPGTVQEAAPSGVKLLDLDGLLDELGARIFVAEPDADTPKLVAETGWSVRAAASFALACAEHVIRTGSASAEVASTLGDVVTAARKWLDEADDADTGLLGRYARLALARRLRRQGDQVAHLAFDLAIDDEAAGVDIFDDPNWTAVAATRDAVLAAVEAVRHDSGPHLIGAESTRYEEGTAGDPVSATFETPWGPFHTGTRKASVPAWVAATEAAERARQSAGDAGGADAGASERVWQRDLLLQALRGS